ncbi:PAS domain-containing sensor histidine kinase [Gramella jeungdoensis]|uniref:histidine kinase n=1 Tax=Gramella jeungdoensis TaxID=708091 RepID=A0ABT0Z4C9_9FLAO|nr:PAS domain-containing sensor histidine kinase [Gramella jeungdoensis]MCM8570075.1 PAS domain-containing sensor histidine kinase [Gramella jeungdoensis]
MDKDLRIQKLEKELEESHKKREKLEKQNSSYEKSHAQLKEENYQLKGLIYSSTALITFLKGPEYRVEFANNPIIKAWGKGDDVIGQPLFDVVPEVRDQGIEEYLNQVYYKGEPYHAKTLPVEHDINGEMVKSYFDFSYMPQYNLDGQIVGVGVIAQDVTKQALLNQKIKKSEKEFRGLVDFMPHKISIADADGNTLFYNKSWLDYTGMSMTEFLESHWTEIIHPDHIEKVEKERKHSLKSGKTLDLELKMKDKNGDYKWHLHRSIAMKDDGIITSWVSSSTEIQKLKEEEQRKQDFLKLVSHELKTPVTSIKGYVQLLQTMINGENDKSKQPYLHRIEDQVERLIKLISEILDLSRIEQSELELNIEEFSLNKHVENIIEDISYSHKDVQIELEHLCECDVKADKDRIGQVIINFITNALKYSPDSKNVQVKVFHEEENNVAVSVKDFGIGIEKKDINRIFNRFYRASSMNEKTYSGFGIGLYLSNEIIERHNGKIFVDSEPGAGSEFTFILPLNQN